MRENSEGKSSSNHASHAHRENDKRNATHDYLLRATQASQSGDAVLGMHLYLAAFELAQQADDEPEPAAIDGLKEAWALACACEENSLAEHILEKLEPYLSPEEMDFCMDELQELALGKLEEFGFSADDLEDITEAFSQDIMDLGLDMESFAAGSIAAQRLGSGSKVLKISHKGNSCSMQEQLRNAKKRFGAVANSEENQLSEDYDENYDEALQDAIDVVAQLLDEDAQDIQDAHTHTSSKKSDKAQANKANTSAGKASANSDKGSSARGDNSSRAGNSTRNKDDSSNSNNTSARISKDSITRALKSFADAGNKDIRVFERLTYKDLIGYDKAIEAMRDFGIGMKKDPEFLSLLDTLNARHGLSHAPAADALIFRSTAREDASQFLAATLGEIGLPAVRMRMEEGMGGIPVLCVMIQSDNPPKLNAAHDEFVGSSVLILEDLDLWESPLNDSAQDFGAFLIAQLSRGAKEAVSLIQSAVENPEVYVLASASNECDIDPFFLDLLQPFKMVDINEPTPEERALMWLDLAREHPSLRSINRSDLVRLSSGMPRYDIYTAVREAIDQSYKEGLAKRAYVPVTAANLFEKLAAYQPLESNEYKDLEEEVIKGFRADLSHIDDLLE